MRARLVLPLYETQVPIEAFLRNGGPRREFVKNTLASEFGVNTEAEALDFMKNELPSFSLVSYEVKLLL